MDLCCSPPRPRSRTGCGSRRSSGLPTASLAIWFTTGCDTGSAAPITGSFFSETVSFGTSARLASVVVREALGLGGSGSTASALIFASNAASTSARGVAYLAREAAITMWKFSSGAGDTFLPTPVEVLFLPCRCRDTPPVDKCPAALMQPANILIADAGELPYRPDDAVISVFDRNADEPLFLK